MSKGSRIITRLSLVLISIAMLILLRGLQMILSNDYLGRHLLHLAVFGVQEIVGRFMVYFAGAALLVTLWTLLEKPQPRTRYGSVMATTLALVAMGLITWWEISREIVGRLRAFGVKPWLLEQNPLLQGLLAIAAVAALYGFIRLWSRSRVHAELDAIWFGTRHVGITRRTGFAVMLLVLVFGQLLPAVTGGGPGEAPNVLLISIDTVRADHLAPQGYARVTTPNLDALGREGILFRRAYSQAPWTLPSMTTILTSLYPYQHGAILNKVSMHDEVLTLAEAFRNADYTTIGVVSHTFVGAGYGFDQGFQIFDDDHMSDGTDISSIRLTDLSIDYLRTHADEKIFMWIHYFDPHADYLHHRQFPYGEGYTGDLGDTVVFGKLLHDRDKLTPQDLQYVRDVYDSELSLTDMHIGRLLAALDGMGLKKKTIIAVVADHGEAFGDHGHLGHGRLVFDALINVPLMIYDPRRGDLKGLVSDVPVETRWLPRTLLGAAGLDGELMTGANLQDIAKGTAQAPPVFSEGCFAWGKTDRKLAVVLGNWKLIHHFDDGHLALYDLEADPGELNDIYSTHPDILYDLTLLLDARLEEMENRGETGKRAYMSEEDYLRLESLGYI